MSATLATDCPRCHQPLTFEGETVTGCGGGCSLYLVRLALNSEAVTANGNGHKPEAGEEVAERFAATSIPLGELLGQIVGFVRSFVAMTEHEATAVAVWTAHTYAIDAANATPYLSVTSAEKESGKTRLLEVLDLLVARPWLTGRATAAVLPRKIQAERPTLLLDESDAAFKGDKQYAETLRGVLNSGHRRGGKTTVCVGQGAEIGFADFSTFCPKAIAGIGKLPDTVQSRSIPIRLKRRGPGEHVERFRFEEAMWEAEPLRSGLELAAEEIVIKASVARPELPDELGDRAMDCWEPLLAIADLAGGDWPEAARKAARELSGAPAADDDSMGVQLLADVRAIFEDVDRLATESLLRGLHGLAEAPWSELFGRPLSARGLARLLKPYGIQSRSVRLEDGSTPKGFLREQFEDAWERYTPPEGGQKRHNAATRSQSGIEANLETPQESLVADEKSAANPHGQRDVAEVADSGPEGAGLDRCGHCGSGILVMDEHDDVACHACGRQPE